MATNLRGRNGLRMQNTRMREDVDPMASVANLADVMLVFACGLMMALVSLMGIDFSELSEITSADVQEIEEPEDLPDDLSESGSAYIERGVVFQDPTTGKYYIRLDEDSDEGSSDSSETSASGGLSGSSGVAAPDRASGAD